MSGTPSSTRRPSIVWIRCSVVVGEGWPGRSWGFCQAVYDSGAFGWDGGLGTSWLVDPSRNLTVIVLTQCMFESPDPPQVHRDIQAAAYAALA